MATMFKKVGNGNKYFYFTDRVYIMNKFIAYTTFLTVIFSSTQAFASPTIKTFMASNNSQAYFNCAFKGKKASRKCLVTNSYISSDVHPTLKQIYGANTQLPLITIKWPDGDTSRYVSMDSFELGNLGDKRFTGYQLRTTDEDYWDLDLSRGLIIDSNYTNQEYVRLW
ncbi:hypothetical protein [Psychrobacter ciconiae]|uniref:hypothetical protein n=1 Tax=Psychrobacter ciconiae TaxID=1553449 RepID=UPI001917B3E8|nr:hypothetical protein [Psychrobacter ciconiae]